MTRLGKLLLLLACALLLGVGVLARSAEDAAASAGTPGASCSSCCPDDCHCGGQGAVCACDHRAPQAPLPARSRQVVLSIWLC